MITLKKLKKWNACYGAYCSFEKVFGSGRPTAKKVLAALKKSRNPMRKNWLVWLIASPACAEMLAGGANPNQADKEGVTPLHWAAFRGNIESVRALIKAGADVNAEDDEGIRALSDARQDPHSEIVELLKEAGATE